VVHQYQSRVQFQIWHRDGRLALRSANAPSTPISDREGFADLRQPDGRWRSYSQWDRKGEHRVVVAENHAGRDELAGKIALRLLTPALLGLPLLGFWVWLSTRRGLAPLNTVADQIAEREPGRLQPLALGSAPEEIRPLVDAINSLFDRVEQTLEAERRFTADAAHELRTPLAALATQAQVTLRARNDEERSHAVEQLIASTRRAARLVDQLLTLARLDPDEQTTADTVRLDQLAEAVCAIHGAPALDKGVDLELNAVPATVAGNTDMLRILLRNLVDNAIRYTPAGGRVTVAVSPGLLSVTDTGPGIPPEERERVFDRFHRLAGQETEGSGLGLSIVARIAERHGAKISLDAGDAGAGLKVTLRFPAAAG
jgi:signal transduction histidine kinase